MRAVVMNPGGRNRKRRARGRRRGRRSNPLWRILSSGKFSGRSSGKRKSRRMHISRRRPHHWHNPFRNPAGVMGGLTAGFRPSILMEGAVIVGGGLLNGFVSKMLVERVPQIPDALKTGPGKYILGLTTAGLTYLGTSRFAPKYANKLLLGGVATVAMEAAHEMLSGTGFLGRIGDFLTQGQVNSARNMQGMDDFLRQSQVDSARQMGAYDPIAEDLAMAEGV